MSSSIRILAFVFLPAWLETPLSRHVHDNFDAIQQPLRVLGSLKPDFVKFSTGHTLQFPFITSGSGRRCTSSPSPQPADSHAILGRAASCQESASPAIAEASASLMPNPLTSHTFP